VCSRGVLIVSAAKHACLYASYDRVCNWVCVDYCRGVLLRVYFVRVGWP
jgi:hypothetical protein